MKEKSILVNKMLKFVECFKNNPKVRLINPAKNKIGWISKNILDKTSSINHNLCTSLSINQWKDASEVIEWFLKIPYKNRYKFAIFEIEDFYPSIPEKLLTKVLKFSKEITDISRDDMQVTYHARKSLLFSDEKPWMKRQWKFFDFTMGA